MVGDRYPVKCTLEKRPVQLIKVDLVAHMQRSCGVKHKEDAYNSILLEMNICSHKKYFIEKSVI